jgi:replication factor C subunit 2/4
MKERLATIAQAEHCPLSPAQLDCILQLSEGDMRRAVQTLQSVHALTMGGTKHVALTEGDIAELVGLPPAKVVDDLVQRLVESKGMMKQVQAAVEDICLDGYSAQTLLGCLLQRFLTLPQLDEMGRAKLAIRIAEAEHCMLDGADEYLQLLTVCGLAVQCIKNATVKTVASIHSL